VVSALIQRTGPVAFDEDVVLVERFRAGDQSAFQPLYERYHDRVYAIARGVLGDADDAADSVQDVFTLVCRKINSFQSEAKFSTWLFRIAVNASIQLARKNRFRSRQTALEAAEDHVGAEDSHESADPKIYAVLQYLAPADRALLVMFYWEELPITEIAAAIDCSPNAAKTRLYRARERFREAYGEPDEN
jgi:RNA polymerase sigma-70 factor (ECF subfamily)